MLNKVNKNIIVTMRNEQFLSVNYNSSNKMGNSQAQPQKIKLLDKQNWIQAGQDQQQALFSNVNPYRRRLLSNLSSSQLIQQYQIHFISQQDYICYIKQLTLRVSCNSPCHIYPIHSFSSQNKYQLCTTVYSGLLYIQKVDLRLKQINDIPFNDLIYMYKATLQGFKILYQRVGYFDILEEMVFIDRKGGVKVWMNPNLSKNYPNFQRNDAFTNKSKDTSQSIYGSQAEMIKDLILLIEKNFDQNQKTSSILLSQYLKSKHIFQRLSFDDSLDQFQFYISQNNLYCPSYMKSIPQLFTPTQPQNHSHQSNRYQQSHVNQITTNHLNQIKEKYKPMQNIQQAREQMQGKELLARSTLRKYQSVKQDRFYDNQGNRTGQRLQKSQHSSKSRNYKVDKDHLQKSSHSHLPIIPPQMSKMSFNPNYYRLHNPHQLSYQLSPPNPTINNLPISYTPSYLIPSLQKPYPPQSYHPVFRQSFTPHRQFVQTSKINFTAMSSQNAQGYIGQQMKGGGQVARGNSDSIGLKANNTAIDKHSQINSHKLSQVYNNKLSNSKIKYYSTTQAYQLDQEIANDLQLFLGLKVN